MFTNTPIKADETVGKKFYCTCGLSENKPYCDGKHSGSGKFPCAHKIEEAKTVFVCDCGKSGNTPFCDGSHAK